MSIEEIMSFQEATWGPSTLGVLPLYHHLFPFSKSVTGMAAEYKTPTEGKRYSPDGAKGKCHECHAHRKGHRCSNLFHGNKPPKANKDAPFWPSKLGS